MSLNGMIALAEFYAILVLLAVVFVAGYSERH